MHRPLLKVCGLTDPIQAGVVASLGADAVGVIGVGNSPRHVEPSLRSAVFSAVESGRPACLRVLVVADPLDAELTLLAPEAGHRVVQLHGAESVQRCRELRSQVQGVAWWKALRIRTAADLEQAHAYADEVDALLLDAWVPDQLGGTGHRLPLEWLEEFRPTVPWWLAGGITPERVAEVLQMVRPFGLDASSGVEDAPGRKNLARVEALVEAVRQAAGPISG